MRCSLYPSPGVLSQGRPKYVNGRTRGRAGKAWLADGPFARADEQQLQKQVSGARSTPPIGDSSRGNASAGTSRFSMRISLEAETNRRHACRDAGYRILLLTSTLYDTYMTRTVFISHTDIQQMWSGLSSSTKRTAASTRASAGTAAAHLAVDAPSHMHVPARRRGAGAGWHAVWPGAQAARRLVITPAVADSEQLGTPRSYLAPMHTMGRRHG